MAQRSPCITYSTLLVPEWAVYFCGEPYQTVFSLQLLKDRGGSTSALGSGEMSPMKSFRKEIWIQVPQRRALVNITPTVASYLAESGIREGLCLVNAMHISASVFINDDEPGLHSDIERWLEGLAPEHPHHQYAHNRGEDNADAHLKRTLMGREVVVAVTDGQFDFGPWEQIFYGEFDGLRKKRVLVKIIGE